jgi:hypothetical protein
VDRGFRDGVRLGSRGRQDFVQSPKGRTRVQRSVCLRGLPLQSDPKRGKRGQRGARQRRNHRRLPQTQTQRFGPANLHWKKNEAYVTSHNVVKKILYLKSDSICFTQNKRLFDLGMLLKSDSLKTEADRIIRY